MIKTGPKNLITDVDGIKIGNAEDQQVVTGVTAVIPDNPAVAGVDVRGGGPGTRETDALKADTVVEHVTGIVLSGGSVFGLEAASGAVAALAKQRRGFIHRGICVPIVPSAILFDLANGGDKNWQESPPYRELGISATENAATDFSLGNTGAGYGSTANVLKGGLGSASAVTEDGIQIGAVIAVNPVGSVLISNSPNFWSWPFEIGAEFGGLGAPKEMMEMALDLPEAPALAENTTIGVVATNVALSKPEATRLAVMAQDGIARAIRPVHTPFDGDTIFTLSTEQVKLQEPKPLNLARIGAIAADCVARAVARGVYHAESLSGFPGYQSEYFKN